MPGGFSWHGFTLSFAFLLSETQRGSDRSHLFFAASASVEKTSQFMSNRGASPVAWINRGLRRASASGVYCAGRRQLEPLMLLWLRGSIVCVRICDGTSFKSCRFFEGSVGSAWRIGRHTLRFFLPYPVQLLQCPDS